MIFLSLLKAALTQDMNLFKYTFKKNSSRFKRIMLPIILFLLVCYSIGIYAYEIAKVLHPLNLTYIMLSIFLMLVTIISFMEGIHKSQGILFESKDNDLLFPLPIKRSYILAVRLIKLLLFQYLFNMMFLLPSFVIYIYYEHPGINFYIISILISILIPIIPTIISSFIGYIIQLISSKSKNKKLVQILLTSLFLIVFLGLSSNSNNLIKSLGEHAKTIQELLTKIYYPIGAYTTLISKFDIIVLVKLLLINIIPFVIFILIGQKFYFKIISRSHNRVNRVNKNQRYNYKNNSQLIALTKKELKRYFSSPVYIFNTSFGLILLVVMTIILGVKGKDTLQEFLSVYGVSKGISLELLFYGIIMGSLLFTSISSSSISLEGKTILFTKSLPIDYKIIIKSKILNCLIIELPFALISILLYIVFYKVKLLFILQLVLLSILTIFYMAITGLIINLKYPKLNASNDTEVVKQSMSTMISMFVGIGTFFFSILGFAYFIDKINIKYLLWIHLIVFIVISSGLYYLLIKNGPEKYRKLNV